MCAENTAGASDSVQAGVKEAAQGVLETHHVKRVQAKSINYAIPALKMRRLVWCR